jgi:hypothetical protein
MTAHTNITQSPSLQHSRPKAHQAYSGQRKSALATLRRFLRSRSRKADATPTRAWDWVKSRREATLRSRTLCSRSVLRRRRRAASWDLGARRSWWRYPRRSNCLLCRRIRCTCKVKDKDNKFNSRYVWHLRSRFLCSYILQICVDEICITSRFVVDRPSALN